MSIRSRLLLLVVAATMLPALLGLARFLQDREQSIADETAKLVAIAHQGSHVIADRVQGTAQLHYGLARAQDLHAGDRAACSAFLSDVREAYPQYTGILTIDPDGQLFCDSLQSGRDLDLRDRAYFQAAVAASDEIVLEPTFGRLTGLAVLQIAYPVRSDDGSLAFVLLASLDLQRLIRLESSVDPDVRVLVLDDEGTVLATSHDDVVPVAAGESIAGSDLFAFAVDHDTATTELARPDGAIEVWAHDRSDAMAAAGLHIVAGAQKVDIVGPADARFRQDLLLAIVVALGAILGTWIISEVWIRRPVRRIAGMADRLAAGDLSARIPAPLPHGELGQLMATMNQTAQALEQQRADIDALDERVRRSQRLEAIGQLTGGVAHDFNNLLTVVMGNAELLADDPAATDDQRAMARTIGGAAQRGADLTQHLLAFARRQALAPTAVDVNALVAEMDPILRRTLGEHIDIVLDPAVDLWPAMVDQGQMENALLNLCVNARDAMGGGGRLTIETGNVRLDEEYVAGQEDVAAGPYVMVAVSDTGSGVHPEHLSRVFEPFFTTKDKGKGTGLGLAMVYGFVKQSAGHITIYSEVGQGTTVRLYLPRASEAPGAGPATAPSSAALVGGTETILLVEDDPDVRRIGLSRLRELGYRVLEAEDGRAALALIEQHDDVDLLFTDVVMPGGMDGRALADAARARRPGLRVLFTSGYSEHAIVHNDRLDPDARLLSKPYRMEDLARAIRAALDEGRPNPSA